MRNTTNGSGTDTTSTPTDTPTSDATSLRFRHVWDQMHAARNRRRAAKADAEFYGGMTERERLELDSILDRYDDEQTAAIRDGLNRGI